MQFSNARHKRSFTYTMQGLPLYIVDRHSYLGVVLDHKLFWELHLNYFSNRVNQLLVFLNRNLITDNQHLCENSYKQLVLPVLDYCAAIWDLYYHNTLHWNKKLHNRAACFVLNYPWRRHYHNSVSSMISTLNWQSLQTRRRNAWLILLYRIFHDYQTIPHQTIQAPLNTRSNHNQKLQHYQSRTNVYKVSFFPHTVPEWYDLTTEQVSAMNLGHFKTLFVQYKLANLINLACDINVIPLWVSLI